MLKAQKNITLPPGLQRACLCLATGGKATAPTSRLRDFSRCCRADAGIWCPRGLAYCVPSPRPPVPSSSRPPIPASSVAHSRPPPSRSPGGPRRPAASRPRRPFVPPSVGLLPPSPPSVGLLRCYKNRVDWVYPNPNPKIRVPAISGSNISGLISGIILHYPKLRVPEFLDPKFSGNPNAHPYSRGRGAPEGIFLYFNSF
jgi:hypothetical protein